jgi:hypothetical protein
LLAKDSTGEHRLLRCSVCDQHWQVSRAWNWGNDPYAFRIPSVSKEEWLQDRFVDPDELLIYAALLESFPLDELSGNPCHEPGCARSSLSQSIFCAPHHLRQLQAAGLFPGYPPGRWFPPYVQFST